MGAWGGPEAREAYHRFQLDWAAPAGAAGGRPSGAAAALVLRWIARCKPTYRKRGRVTSEVYCNRAGMDPLVELFGDGPAADFTPAMLRTVREAMVAKKWVRKTINDHVARILRAFAWAVTEGMIPAPVHAALALVGEIPAGRRDDVPEGRASRPVPSP
jgi:hypothetical protein